MFNAEAMGYKSISLSYIIFFYKTCIVFSSLCKCLDNRLNMFRELYFQVFLSFRGHFIFLRFGL